MSNQPKVGDQLQVAMRFNLPPRFATISGVYANEIEYISSQDDQKVSGGRLSIKHIEPLDDELQIEGMSSALSYWQVTSTAAEAKYFCRNVGEQKKKVVAEGGGGQPKPLNAPFTVSMNWHGQVMTYKTEAPSEKKARSNGLYRLAGDVNVSAQSVFNYFKEREVEVKRGH